MNLIIGERIQDKDGNVYEVLGYDRPTSPLNPCDWSHANRSGMKMRRVSDGREFVASLQMIYDCVNGDAE